MSPGHLPCTQKQSASRVDQYPTLSCLGWKEQTALQCRPMPRRLLTNICGMKARGDVFRQALQHVKEEAQPLPAQATHGRKKHMAVAGMCRCEHAGRRAGTVQQGGSSRLQVSGRGVSRLHIQVLRKEKNSSFHFV